MRKLKKGASVRNYGHARKTQRRKSEKSAKSTHTEEALSLAHTHGIADAFICEALSLAHIHGIAGAFICNCGARAPPCMCGGGGGLRLTAAARTTNQQQQRRHGGDAANRRR